MGYAIASETFIARPRFQHARRQNSKGSIRRAKMKHPMKDKAQVSIDFPEKFYVGSFGRDSSLDVTADQEGVHIHLERQVDRKRRVGFHVHYYLLADLLQSIGQALAGCKEIDPIHRSALADATRSLTKAVAPKKRTSSRRPRHSASDR